MINSVDWELLSTLLRSARNNIHPSSLLFLSPSFLLLFVQASEAGRGRPSVGLRKTPVTRDKQTNDANRY